MNTKRVLVIIVITALVCLVIYQFLSMQKLKEREKKIAESTYTIPADHGKKGMSVQEIRAESDKKAKEEHEVREQKKQSNFDMNKPAGLFGPDNFSPKLRESEWIASSIITDLYRMIWTQHKTDIMLWLEISFDDDFHGPVFKYSTNISETSPRAPIDEKNGELKVDYIWDYRGYADIIKKYITTNKADETTINDKAEILEDLLSPTSEEFLRHRKSINERFSTSLLDVSAHLDAAVLKSAFALLNADGVFFDVREDLSRITAHLAMAYAIDPSSERNLGFLIAHAIVLSLCGRTADANKIIENANNKWTSPTVASWRNVLRLRASKDWRIFPGPERPRTILERIELIRSVAECKGVGEAVKLYQEYELPIYFLAHKYVLNDDATFPELPTLTEDVIRSERRRLEITLQQYDEKIIRNQGKNNTQAPCLVNNQQVLDVLPPENWRNAAIRSCLNCAWLRYQLYYNRLGWAGVGNIIHGPGNDFYYADLAKILNAMIDEVGSNEQMTQEERERKYLEVSKFQAQYPHLVPLRIWKEYSLFCGKNRLHKEGNRVISVWFRGGEVPFGTAYGVPYVLDMGGIYFGKKEQIIFWHSLFPENIQLKYKWFEQNKDKLELNQATRLEEFIKDDAEINPRSIRAFAYGTYLGPESRIELLKIYANSDKNGLIDLGIMYLRIGNEEMAEETLFKAFIESPDKIYVSNAMEWLVERYYRTNRKEQAIQIADFCLQVGSERGITTRAKLAEWMGDLVLAEKLLETIYTMYKSDAELYALWTRNKDAFTKKIFPNGFIPLDMSTLKKPPLFGVRLVSDSEKTKVGGLQTGMIIVGIDGNRVLSKKEYTLMRLSRDEPLIVLTFWDGLQYQTVEFNTMEHRRLGFAMETIAE